MHINILCQQMSMFKIPILYTMDTFIERLRYLHFLYPFGDFHFYALKKFVMRFYTQIKILEGIRRRLGELFELFKNMLLLKM